MEKSNSKDNLQLKKKELTKKLLEDFNNEITEKEDDQKSSFDQLFDSHRNSYSHDQIFNLDIPFDTLQSEESDKNIKKKQDNIQQQLQSKQKDINQKQIINFRPKIPSISIDYKYMAQFFSMDNEVNSDQEQNQPQEQDDFKMDILNNKANVQRRMELLHKQGGIECLLNLLRVNPKKGIDHYDEEDLELRKKQFGVNIVEKKKKSKLVAFIKEILYRKRYKHLFIWTMVLFIVKLLHHQDLYHQSIKIDIGTFIMIFLNIMCKSIKEEINDTKFSKFQNQTFNQIYQQNEPQTKNKSKINKDQSQLYKTKVLRNSSIQLIPNKEIVVGDIVYIEQGDILKVDGIIIKSNSSKIVVSEMHQGSYWSNKNKHQPLNQHSDIYIDPFVYFGTNIMEGSGYVLVCAVGSNVIKEVYNLQENDYKSSNPLSDKIKEISSVIGRIGMNIALIYIFILALYILYRHYYLQESIFTFACLLELMMLYQFQMALEILLIPDGLLESVNTYLVFAFEQLKKQDITIKEISAFQHMGFLNFIITDKTGCLTQNKNKAYKLYYKQSDSIKIPDLNQDQKNFLMQDAVFKKIINNICINSTAFLKQGQKTAETCIENGNKVDIALLKFASEYIPNMESFRYNFESKKKIVYPFSNSNKRMITVYKKDNGGYRVFVKGSPDLILDKCNYENIPQNIFQSQQLNKNSYTNGVSFKDCQTINRNKIRKIIDQFGVQESLRMVLFAYRDITDHVLLKNEDMLMNDLIFQGIIGIQDPFRVEAENTIYKCRKAGLHVIIVTGDNKETSMQTGKKLQHWDSNVHIDQQILDSHTFRNLVGPVKSYYNRLHKPILKLNNIEQFQETIQQLRLITKTTSEDKRHLVAGLRQLKYVVAITGDETEDSKILRQSQIGIGLGTSSEVVKNAASIIFEKDNLASIITLILYSRNTYDYIRRYFQIIMIFELVLLVILFMNIFLNDQQFLNSAKFLFLNLTIDEFTSYALAKIEPSGYLLYTKPISTREYILNPIMLKNIILQSLYQIIILLILMYSENKQNFISYQLCFPIFLYFQLFNAFNPSPLQGHRPFWNRIRRKGLLMFCIFIVIIMYIIISDTDTINTLFQFEDITYFQHTIALLIGLSTLFANSIINHIPYLFFKGFHCFNFTFNLEN